ncbi:MAG: hypothetical protein ACQEUZ_11390 [Pseudomonadota bacterium]
MSRGPSFAARLLGTTVLAAGLVLSGAAVPARAQTHESGGGGRSGGAAGGGEAHVPSDDRDHSDATSDDHDHTGSDAHGGGKGPEYKGGGSGGHDEGGDDHDHDDHEEGESGHDGSEGGPRYRGGRDAGGASIPRGRPGGTLEDRVLSD